MGEKQKDRKKNVEEEKTRKEVEEKEDIHLEEYGQATLNGNAGSHHIYLLSIIGEIEGHENLPAVSYTHLTLPTILQV